MRRLFTVEELHAIAREVAALDLPRQERFDRLVELVSQRHPGRLAKKRRFVLNSANGALGTIAILYASLSEYLLIFGSPIGTEGHSGRYFATVHDFMLEGEMRAYVEGDIDQTIFRPGDHATLGFRSAKGYRICEDTWMLEYARGCIPLMLPAGVWDNLFSNLDWRSLFLTFWDYGRLTIRELIRGKI
jgi:hypothetical protein